MTLLKKGSQGNRVKELQEHLNNFGYNVGTADGIFGPRTETGVKNFQEAHNLVVDGIVGAQTMEAVETVLKQLAAATPVDNRVLKLGCEGDDVTELQNNLIRWGLFTVPDGIYGERTKTLVNEFQRGLGLVPDGVAGAITLAFLKSPIIDINRMPAERFRCQCGGKYCSGNVENVAWSIRIMALRICEVANIEPEQLIITSGHRCNTWNKIQKGATYSQHRFFRAMDWKIKGMSVTRMNEIAKIVNPYGGNGLRGNTITHCDTRGYASVWYYN